MPTADTFYATTDAFVGQAYLGIGNGESPETFERYCEVYELPEFGEKNDQVDATTFCNGGSKQYIPGLSDGTDFTFSANLSKNNLMQAALIEDVKNKVTRHFTITIGDDSPSTVYTFAVAMLEWGIALSVTGKNVVKFMGKITGPIEIAA